MDSQRGCVVVGGLYNIIISTLDLVGANYVQVFCIYDIYYTFYTSIVHEKGIRGLASAH